MKRRFCDFMAKCYVLGVIILIIFAALYMYAGIKAYRYQRYYAEIVHSLETGKGMSTPDFTITRVNGYKIMAIRLNKNMPSSLDVGLKTNSELLNMYLK